MTAAAWHHDRFAAMGTMVSLGVQLADVAWPNAFFAAKAAFEELEARFSLYRPESELSRIADGSLSLPRASVELREAYALAVRWRNDTGGAFTPDRPDGVLDLNGVVKALAIEQVGEVLRRSGAENFSINAGGDILYGGVAASGEAWTTGITDPLEPGVLLTSVELFGENRAIATSGFTERGQHIWLHGAGGGSVGLGDFSQVSVMAPDIVTADALATAILAASDGHLARFADLAVPHGAEVLAVTPDGSVYATPGIRSQIRADS
jgi:thiamine biosynthesis lipoprotein